MSSVSFVSELSGEISAQLDVYQPNERVTEVLQATTLAMIIGPMAVGKDSLRHEMAELDPDFHMVRSFTTRPIRPGEKPDSYHFLGHETDSLQLILDSLKEGEVVQCVVHPTTGMVYGSHPDEYDKPYSILDVLGGHFDEIVKLPFGTTLAVSVAVEPEHWEHRLKERASQTTEADIAKRLVEARESLEWSLSQGSEGIWVLNADGGLDKAASDTIAIVRGKSEPDPTARQAGERLLRKVIELQA